MVTVRIKCIMHIKYLRQYLAHSKHYINVNYCQNAQDSAWHIGRAG